MRAKIKEVQNLQETLDDISVSGGGSTQAPNTTLDLANDISTITMAGNLVVDTITNAPAGASLRQYIHGGDSLTVLGKSDFIDKDGMYHVKVINYGSLGLPDLKIFDSVGGGGTGLTPTQEVLLNDMIAAKPTALAVALSGTEEAGNVLTINYEYGDLVAPVRAESGSTFKWFRADDALGSGEAEIGGETNQTYTLVSGDVDKFIRGEVTPVNAEATGSAYSTAYSNAIASSVLLSDDFDTGTIDPSKWVFANPTAPDLVLEESGGYFKSIGAGNGTSTIFVDYIRSNVTTSGRATVALDMISRSAGSNLAPNLMINVDSTNYARIALSVSANAVLKVNHNGSSVYEFTTSVNMIGKRMKITIDDSNNIKFWWWEIGVSVVWTQMGTTQQFDLGGPKHMEIYAQDYPTASTAEMDRARFSVDDYATELP